MAWAPVPCATCFPWLTGSCLAARVCLNRSVRTVKWALGQHVRDGDKVTLLHVTPEYTPAAHSLPGPGPFAALHEREQEQRKRRSAEEQRVSRRLHSWVHHYSPQGVSITWETASMAPSAVAMSGDGGAARDCILSEAGRMKADCLIVGSHRASSDSSGSPSAASAVAARGLRSLSFGTAMPTSEYCAQHSPCPVIVVPPMPTPPDAAAFDKSCAAVAASVGNTMPSAFLDSLAL